MVIAIFEVLSMIAALIGGFIVLAGVGSSQSDVSIAASAGLGLAVAVIPYCISATLHRARMRYYTENAAKQD